MTLTLRQAAEAMVNAFDYHAIGGWGQEQRAAIDDLRKVLAQPDLDTPVLDLVDEWELAYAAIDDYSVERIGRACMALSQAVRARRAGGTP